jgi:uncharacterized Tic20 family protein
VNTNTQGNSTHDEVYVRQEVTLLELGHRLQDVPNVDGDDGLFPSSSLECADAVICHVGGAMTCVVLPLIQLLVARKRSPFVAHHAREAINFQFTLLIASMQSAIQVSFIGVLCVLIAPDPLPLLQTAAMSGIGVVVLLWIWEIVLVMAASVAAFRGRQYHYPLCIRLVRTNGLCSI